MKNIRLQGRNRVKEMEMRRREEMKDRREEIRQQQLDEIFDEEEEEAEPAELVVEPSSSLSRQRRTAPQSM